MGKIKFQDMKSEQEILMVCYSMWKKSIDEYKDGAMDKCYRKYIGEAMKYRWYHCRIVGELALESYNRSVENNTINENGQVWKMLYFAALTHDIKKFDHKHSRSGANWIENNINDFLEIDEADINCIYELIRLHKTKIVEEKEEDFLLLLRVLQEGDRLSKYREKF